MAVRQCALESMDMSPNFWYGKRVFVTGHTGFKGAWLCLWLQRLGAEVTGYALAPPTSPSLFEVANVEKGIKSIIGDIRDLNTLSQVLRTAEPEVVIHMAAQPLVRRSYIDPVETYSTNVMGTVNLLEAVRQTPAVRSVVIVTTDKCYENKEWVWGYRENEPMGGVDPYSSSKGCAEFVTAAYRNSFFNSSNYCTHRVAVASARAGNVIGGGDWAQDRLIPDILRALMAGQDVNIRNPHAQRPWQHVLEPLSGYLLLAEKLYINGPAFAEAFNFGPSDEDARPVKWIVEQMTESWGDVVSWCIDKAQHPHEAHYLKLDCSKARETLGWVSRWDLAKALQAIIIWHKTHIETQCSDHMRALCMKQIDEYTFNS